MNNRRHFLKLGSLAGLVLPSMASSGLAKSAIPAVAGSSGGTVLGTDYTSLDFVTGPAPDPVTVNAIGIVKRILSQRTGLDFKIKGTKSLRVRLEVIPKVVPPESFRITHGPGDTVTLLAGDPRGIVYGLGKFLHTCSLTPSGLTPGNWQGLSIPEKPFRKIYFATHYHNFYHSAPVEKVTDYIQELALWGYNGLIVWFDMHHFTGIDDPEAGMMLDRLALFLKEAKRAGMDAGITLLANEGYRTTPEKLKATAPTQLKVRGRFGVEICPSQPGGPELIVKQFSEEMDAFAARGVELDYLSIWPYDQGGCGCKDCAPWGANGFLRMTRRIAALVKEKRLPTRLVQSTWLFDAKEDEGEWSGLAEAYRKERPPVDYIMADSHDAFPSYPLENPSPGDLPMLNFPEISMWGSFPWGGFGANPLPQRFQEIWNSVKDKLAGGFPYSEGLFEDINKVVYSQFYWDSGRPAAETVREYVSFEFSARYADQIVEAIGILEKNHGLEKRKGNPKAIVPPQDHGAEKAYRLLTEVDGRLPGNIRKSWRWRVLMIRAMFDYEFRKNQAMSNEKTDAGFRELIELYHNTAKARPSVSPPL